MSIHSLARSHAVAIVLLLLACSCAKSPTSPAAPALQLTTSVTPQKARPSDAAIIDAVVVSKGTQGIWHCEGCGCGNGIRVEVLDPDGIPVALSDPKAALPACADGLVRLDPGGRLDRTVTFTGTLYVRESPTYPTPTYTAPPGRYTVVVTFGYATGRMGETQELRRTASFDWTL